MKLVRGHRVVPGSQHELYRVQECRLRLSEAGSEEQWTTELVGGCRPAGADNVVVAAAAAARAAGEGILILPSLLAAILLVSHNSLLGTEQGEEEQCELESGPMAVVEVVVGLSGPETEVEDQGHTAVDCPLSRSKYYPLYKAW